MPRYDYQRVGINRFTGHRKEFCKLNSGAWIWTVDRFLAQQSAAPDGKSVDGTNRATPADELDGGQLGDRNGLTTVSRSKMTWPCCMSSL